MRSTYKPIVKGSKSSLQVDRSKHPFSKPLVQPRQSQTSNGNLTTIVISDSDDSVTTEKYPHAKEVSAIPQFQQSDLSTGYQFEEMPIYQPTEEEFKNPFELFNTLYRKGFETQGCVKIIPPDSWKPEFQFHKIQHKLTTRTQILKDLNSGIAATSKTLSPLRKNELEFWSIIDNPEAFHKVSVEYAADLPCKKLGSGFPTKSNQEFAHHGFNLIQTNKQPNSLFQFVEPMHGLSGITDPWVYVGMLFATFCWHVEDLYMHALNYHHFGQPKTWYCIPGKYKAQFEELIKKEKQSCFQNNPNLLSHLTLQFNPQRAIKAGIPVYRSDQLPGQFIFTFPRVFHSGFSQGFNCGEAVNIASVNWLPDYQFCLKELELNRQLKKVSIAAEWLLYNLALNSEKLMFSKENLHKIHKLWAEVVSKELQIRRDCALQHKQLKICEFANKKEKYDRYVCKKCDYYMFLSYLSCSNCFQKACSRHLRICSCEKPKITLYMRFNDQELMDLAKTFWQRIESLSN